MEADSSACAAAHNHRVPTSRLVAAPPAIAVAATAPATAPAVMPRVLIRIVIRSLGVQTAAPQVIYSTRLGVRYWCWRCRHQWSLHGCERRKGVGRRCGRDTKNHCGRPADGDRLSGIAVHSSFASCEGAGDPASRDRLRSSDILRLRKPAHQRRKRPRAGAFCVDVCPADQLDADEPIGARIDKGPGSGSERVANQHSAAI